MDVHAHGLQSTKITRYIMLFIIVRRSSLTVNNTLVPQFSKTFLLDYRFEEVQYLRFSVYDVDNKHHVDNISLHDFIGESFCTLADIVTAGQEYNKTLRSNGKWLLRHGKMRTTVCSYYLHVHIESVSQ